MEPNIKNVKNIAYIQNIGLLTNEQIQKYMGDIKYITSDNPIIIYRFIVCLNKCYKITKFCLMINSETLKELNKFIKKNRKLNKCIFFATRSNANSVRNVIAKNIYFSLSSLSVVLNGFLNIPSNYVMTIVSDRNTPYYNQIYNTGPKPVYRISELTVKKVNAFVNKGNASDMLIALNEFPINEFEKLNKILLDPACKYKNFATFIELSSTNIQFIEKLYIKLARINNISSNVSLCGVTNAYPDIDSCTLYQNSAIQFVNFYNEWCDFIKHYIVFNRCTPFPNRIDYGSVYCPITPVVPTTYTVTYNGNTNTSGTAPVDALSPYIAGSTVIVLGNTGDPILEKTGYTFSGWNTAEDGSGTSYSPTDTFIINANTTLYAQWTPIPPTTYTVTYDGNTNTSGTAPVDGSSPYTAGSTVIVLGNTGTPVLVKTGNTFAGWNTAADGSGTSYSPTDTFTINANTTLYAQWTPIPPTTYTVTYDGNTNTSGTAPVDGSSPYIAGSTVTVLGNTGTPVLEKTGFDFAGWNTVADGSGTSYSPTDTFTINANTTLYAQWTPIPPTTYTVTYNGNTNTSGTAPVDGSSPYIAGSTVTVLGNTGTLEKTGNTFSGWNTAADGSGTSYSPADTFTINANTTLYAQWTPEPTYTVTYNGNTNTSGNVPVDGSSPYTDGSTVTVLGNTGTPILEKTGFDFAGWNTAADGSGTSYSPTSTFPINANTTLYAQWTPDPTTTYTMTYNGNTNTSGTALIDGSSPYAAGSTVTVFGNTGSPVLAKTGYQFAGWNTLADGTGTSYVGGNTFPINANTTLYAQWIIGGVRLRYNANSAAGGTGTVPSSSETYYTAYSSQPIVGNTGPFTNTNGYTFGGWNTLANGTGISYPPGSNITMPGAGTVTLYAQWINPAINYTLTYNPGTGGSGTAPNNPNPTDYSSNSTATILDNTGSYANSDPTKIFYGWNTSADGTGTSYPVGSTLTMNASKTLYAQWVSNTSPYTVTYDANGATGGSVPAEPTNYPSDVQVPILGQGSLTNPGYVFLGWNGSPTGAGSLYAPGYTFISKTATLYALWAPGSTIKNCGGGGTGGSAGTPPVTIEYFFPFAQIVQSSDTITVYTTALLRGTTTSNYGTGTAPLGMNSIASKTVITSSQITINTNTSYADPTNDNNYSTTISNGSGVTYWPSGATISNITYATLNPSNSSIPTYNISTKTNFNGCGLTANVGSSSGVVTAYSFYNQGFTINFSNGSSTFIANSPSNILYTASTSPANWVTAPKDRYPYQNIQDSFNALTAITIIPSGGSAYVSPDMPSYTVQYDGNGNTSGTLPNPQYMSPYVSGTTSITIRTNSGVLAKTGFTFSGWNTAADGSGTNYAVSTSYGGGASLILYARWV